MDRLDGVLPSAVATWTVLTLPAPDGLSGEARVDLRGAAPRAAAAAPGRPRRGRLRRGRRSLGLPAFRAKQLAHQYYGRLIADPQQMTDLPAAVRDQVAEAMFPTLLTAAREVTCDAGETRKTLWRAVDGTTFESVLMRYPQAQHGVHLVAGRLRHGVPVLRDRPGRTDPQPVDRRDPRAGACRGRDAARRLGRPAVQRGVHGHGGAAGQLRQGAGSGASHHRSAQKPPASASRPAR